MVSCPGVVNVAAFAHSAAVEGAVEPLPAGWVVVLELLAQAAARSVSTAMERNTLRIPRPPRTKRRTSPGTTPEPSTALLSRFPREEPGRDQQATDPPRCDDQHIDPMEREDVD